MAFSKRIQFWSHYHIHYPQISLASLFTVTPLSYPQFQEITVCFCICSLLLQEILYRWYHTTCSLLCLVLSRSVMFLEFSHAIACVSVILFYCWIPIPLYGCITFCLPIHRLMDIWIAPSIGILWMVLLWTFTYKSLWWLVFISFRYIPKSRVGELNSRCMCSFLKPHQNFFHSGYNHFLFPPAVYGRSNFSHPCRHLVSPIFLVTAILVNIVVISCPSVIRYINYPLYNLQIFSLSLGLIF